MRRLASSLAVAGAAIATIAMAAPAMAGATSTSTTAGGSYPFHSRLGHIYGLVPTLGGTAPATIPGRAGITNNTPAVGSLHYNGGPVMTTNKVYAIYWAPSGYQFPAGYEANINTYFQDLQATAGKNTNVYDVGTQYYQQSSPTAPKQYVQNRTTFGGAAVDTDALPALDPVNCPDTPIAATNGVGNPPSTTAGCVTDGQMQQEISAVVKHEGWKVNNLTEFFMFTAPNIGTCFPAQESETVSGAQVTVTVPLCSFEYFCAYHSSYFDSTINPTSQIIYSNMPYAAETAGNPVTCDEGSYPNGNPSDPEISITSHEHNESITDPFGTGWWDSNSSDAAAGDEIGDMCAWDFGNLYGTAGAQYSQTINGHHYLMQTEWDNTTNGCPGSDSSGNPVPSHPNYDVPEITLTPAVGYQTAPFSLNGLFFAAGDKVASTFTGAGATTGLSVGTSTANASGQIGLFTRVPASVLAGTATVRSTGASGIASALFTVLAR